MLNKYMLKVTLTMSNNQETQKTLYFECVNFKTRVYVCQFK